MPITVFRNFPNPDEREGYLTIAKEMGELARHQPGLVSFKRFTADDGEGLTLVEFEDHAAQTAWATNERHLVARRLGRSSYFSAYDIAVCDVVRRYTKGADGVPHAIGKGVTDLDAE